MKKSEGSFTSDLLQKNKYGPHTLDSDYDVWRLAEPKDNNPYCPPGGDQHLSTYNRWGTVIPKVFPITETRHMTEQVYDRWPIEYESELYYGFNSYPQTDSEERYMDQRECHLPEFFPDYGYCRYQTTNRAAFTRPNKKVIYPQVVMPNPPFLLNQFVRTELQPECDYWKVPLSYGIRKYDDDVMVDEPTPARARYLSLRRSRYRSFDFCRGIYTDEKCMRTPKPCPRCK